MLLCNINVIFSGLVEPYPVSEYLQSRALIGTTAPVRHIRRKF